MNTKPPTKRLFVVSCVDFCDGKRDVVVIVGVAPGASDPAHEAHKASVSAFWDGFKRVIGGRYQTFSDQISAWETCSDWKEAIR